MTRLASATVATLAARQRTIDRILAQAFPAQRAFITDRSRRKYLFCPRRAGKSEGDGLDLYYTSYRYDAARSVYIGLTRQTAKEIMWDKMKELAERLNLGLMRRDFNETELSIRIPLTGARIRLVGMDANKRERAKALGGKFKLAQVDEAASFQIDLRAFIKGFVEPAVQDQRGTIALSGTPDPDEARGFFYDVTTEKEPGWSRHAWDTLDNPHMHAQWAEKLAEIVANDPHYMETTEYKCMYKAMWPDDASGWVYQFSRARNLVDIVPDRIDQRVIALDLGWRDDCAIVESGWAANDRTLYFLHAEKAPGLDFDEIDKRMRRVRDARPGVPAKLVVDGANLQAVMELRRRYQLPLVAADKADKRTFIRLMNTEMVSGRIRVVRGACTPLVVEWSGADEEGTAVRDAKPLVWDRRALEHRPPRMIEDARCANHCADGALYSWRYAWSYLGLSDAKTPVPGTSAAVEAEIAAQKVKIARMAAEEREGDWG